MPGGEAAEATASPAGLGDGFANGDTRWSEDGHVMETLRIEVRRVALS